MSALDDDVDEFLRHTDDLDDRLAVREFLRARQFHGDLLHALAIRIGRDHELVAYLAIDLQDDLDFRELGRLFVKTGHFC